MPEPPGMIISRYAGFIDSTEGNIVYLESPLPLDPSLPQLQKPSWLDDFRRQVGPPIQAFPNSRRYPAPSDQDPLTIFTPMINACSIPAPRWVHVDSAGLGTVLLFTDGAAINNGQPNAKAGCGIVFVPARPRPKGVAFRLEADNGPPTSNRAELLAAINALTLRVWMGEGFARITIASDSEYVVRGICEYVFSWRRRNWTTGQRTPVANKDLWERLLYVVEKWENAGVMVQFYLIKRDLNTEADRLAKEAAVCNPLVPYLKLHIHHVIAHRRRFKEMSMVLVLSQARLLVIGYFLG
jgi:ribonuclease HI